MELRYNTAGPDLTIKSTENTIQAWFTILKAAIDTLQERIKEQAPESEVRSEMLDRLIDIDQDVWDLDSFIDNVPEADPMVWYYEAIPESKQT